MRSKKPWYTLYTLLLILLSVIGSTAIANPKVRVLFDETTHVLKEVIGSHSTIANPSRKATVIDSKSKEAVYSNATSNALMFSTIIQGADEEVGFLGMHV